MKLWQKYSFLVYLACALLGCTACIVWPAAMTFLGQVVLPFIVIWIVVISLGSFIEYRNWRGR